MPRIWVTGEGGEGHWEDVPETPRFTPVVTQNRTPAGVRTTVTQISGTAVVTPQRTRRGQTRLRVKRHRAEPPKPTTGHFTGNVQTGKKNSFVKILDNITPGKQEGLLDFVPGFDTDGTFDITPGERDGLPFMKDGQLDLMPGSGVFNPLDFSALGDMGGLLLIMALSGKDRR